MGGIFSAKSPLYKWFFLKMIEIDMAMGLRYLLFYGYSFPENSPGVSFYRRNPRAMYIALLYTIWTTIDMAIFHRNDWQQIQIAELHMICSVSRIKLV